MLKRIGLVAVTALLLAGSIASAQVYIEGEDEGGESGGETTSLRMPRRAFQRFSLEAATPTGFWAETGAFYEEAGDEDFDAEAITALARFAYGQKMWEAGLEVPYHWVDVDTSLGDFDEDGIGDLRTWGKFIPLDGPMLTAGGGMQISFPTGDEDDFGSGEVEILPFITGSVHLGILDIRGHVGLNILTEGDTDADSLVYGFGGFMPIGEYVALRGEFNTFRVNDNDNAVTSFLPGIDFRIPAGPVDVLIRPTGEVGISNLAADWGIGGSVAVAQAPSEDLPAAPPPPPAAAAEVEPAPAEQLPVRKKVVLRGVQFDFDKADIRADARPVLDAAIETLGEHGNVSVVAEGHTDNVGSDEYNEKLSLRRATSVKGYLVAGGISSARLKVEGYGESKPVASNETEDGRAQNRRVELRVAGD